jgi:hypothetical protein
MTTSFSKKSMLVAALASVMVAGAVGAARAAPDFSGIFEQTKNLALVIPVSAKHAADVYIPTPGKQVEGISNHAYDPDHGKWSISDGHHFWRHHDGGFGHSYWWDPGMFAYGYGLDQFPVKTCRSLALKLEKQHLPFSEERAVLRNHGCAIGRVSWN